MDAPEILTEIIKRRKTEKVMCEAGSSINVAADIDKRNQIIVRDAVETAGWAPFHYNRGLDDIAEPWRAHVLWQDELIKLEDYFRNELKVTNKELDLIAGCNALVLVTWLPEFYSEPCRENSSRSREYQISRDEEHLAATAAMVQNLLLLLTAHDMGTYWSSGFKLREPAVLETLGIATEERFIAALFIEYPEANNDNAIRKAGNQRGNRSDKWIREVST
ncbi:MAG: nitroreductase [Methylophaga sp.]|nr:MAG: nitroreductase [Methylophaga sp.]